jgi:GTP diphosphokinase / guanosine-3',5'-bis(diphosphate) 3'-diphosphatase
MTIFITLPSKEMSKEVNRAAELVKEAHDGQFRKDGKTPFVTHPYAVAQLVYDYFGKTSTDIDTMLISALAHDCVEDVDDFDLDEFLELVYGDRCIPLTQRKIKSIVLALTKNDTLPSRHLRDKDCYDRILYEGDEAVHIKLCDRIHNVQDLDGMTDEHKRRYIAETYFMLGYFVKYAGCDVYKRLLDVTIKRGNELFK